MWVTTASSPGGGPAAGPAAGVSGGSPGTPNEDRALAAGGTVVVVDGVTARTDTGCRHGVAWYADHLAHGVIEHGRLGPAEALAAAIAATADRHRATCDLAHPGTPSAAVAIVRVDAEYLSCLLLGDCTIVIDAGGPPVVLTDDRVSAAARAERAAAVALPAGSPERADALVRMKHAELAARNAPGGFWVAAADPGVVGQAVTRRVPLPGVRRVALLTDGAARAVDMFGLYDWSGLLAALTAAGPQAMIDRVRAAESTDPAGLRWPRTKISDDATVSFFDMGAARTAG